MWAVTRAKPDDQHNHLLFSTMDPLESILVEKPDSEDSLELIDMNDEHAALGSPDPNAQGESAEGRITRNLCGSMRRRPLGAKRNRQSPIKGNCLGSRLPKSSATEATYRVIYGKGEVPDIDTFSVQREGEATADAQGRNFIGSGAMSPTKASVDDFVTSLRIETPEFAKDALVTYKRGRVRQASPEALVSPPHTPRAHEDGAGWQDLLRNVKETMPYCIRVLSLSFRGKAGNKLDTELLSGGKHYKAPSPLVQILLKEDPYLVAGLLSFCAWYVLSLIYYVISLVHGIYVLLIRPPIFIMVFLSGKALFIIRALCAACFAVLFISLADYRALKRTGSFERLGLTDFRSRCQFISEDPIPEPQFNDLREVAPSYVLSLIRHLKMMLLYPEDVIRGYYDGFDQIYVPERPEQPLDLIFWILGIVRWVGGSCFSYFITVFSRVIFIYASLFMTVRQNASILREMGMFWLFLGTFSVITIGLILSLIQIPVLSRVVDIVGFASLLCFFFIGGLRITRCLLSRRRPQLQS
ncbi:hypothetical protein GMRT_12965 [Giardia muris]|uniref:Uncharacterized protein n=1 Tax=Giardia muris TaxID=5742 RepID=A0A4Z1SR37_GIAMU|nr:hypothetical protein GMRT_23005 [Giardia muris]TNJ29575.1 hypothetical protein GMRT_12965 [Giardia muris]|eukprot:TNJ27425.1 hypothetical protein GMRT_23005 [Giardia muris]